MKIIRSTGGPFVGLQRSFIRQWGGVASDGFARRSERRLNDYDAACAAAEGPVRIGLLRGLEGVAILLTMPFETAMLYRGPTYIHFAQVRYAEPEWSFESLKQDVFGVVPFEESISFATDGGPFVLFDAATPGDQVDEEAIRFDVERGAWTLSATSHHPDDETLVDLIKLERSSV